MPPLNLIAFSIFGFLFFIGGEYLLSRFKGKNYFTFAESIANMNAGIAERLLDIFTTGLFFFVFKYIYEHWAFFHIPNNVVTWFALFLFTDFIWYWYHRFGHEVNILWAAHVVHHQSEDFNYTVAARITVFQAFARSIFWAFLPLMGFSPYMISVMLLIHGVYPFFIHTRTIGKLGWLEYIFVTPSHHRVHHSSNEQYLDKNYGDVFIIWDKLFGTFAKEDEPCRYGLTKPINSYSFLWQHFHFILELYVSCKRTKGFGEKLKVVFGKPDKVDENIRPILEKRWLTGPLTSAPYTKLQRVYIFAQTGLSIALLFFATLFSEEMPVLLNWLVVVFILTSLVNTGAMLEQRVWVFYLEYVRVVLILITIIIYFPNLYVFASVLFIAGLITFYFKSIQDYYERWLIS
ncbi:sterol desaturase/sphingolipid hydroxylase (fatty acid hydroxylase superfamily) [Chitinophaga skermanii]|uniref:Sterol desaturase/sphingolipid hydroxylase (Fatty acid hydroxylase superfamily) n=1 Tax=Chitinophaga skermanii TaxID=331697 RepID=A0A327QPR2_9BACT|nr:sterol desaturase family protein [Chitinophaga skermanii]RAJ05343.1 sterol desaturase/sphingolipid hydroxylase (fatty acid hydroxylase superfamily) [Chitinophaga skermanii]